MQRQTSDIVIDGSPQPLHCVGNAGLIKSRTVALLCSIKCPGSVILRAYDLMRDIRNENVTVISGFHSPMENECLKILLRGTCGIVICHARSLPARIPAEFRKPIDEGRLLLMSAFGEAQNRATKETSAERNRWVADLGDILFVPYASSGGKTEALCKESRNVGKRVATFVDANNTGLLDAGAIVVGAAGELLSQVLNGGNPHDASED